MYLRSALNNVLLELKLKDIICHQFYIAYHKVTTYSQHLKEPEKCAHVPSAILNIQSIFDIRASVGLSNFNKSSTRSVTQWSQIAKFMGPTWGPPGSCRPQMGPMLAPWTLLSGMSSTAAHVIASFLMAPSHYLNQHWLIISEIMWYSHQGKKYTLLKLLPYFWGSNVLIFLLYIFTEQCTPRPCFNIKQFSRYGDFHYRDKTVISSTVLAVK